MHLFEQFPELGKLLAVVLEDNEVIRAIVRDTLQELGIRNLRYTATERECIELLSNSVSAVLLVEYRDDWPVGLRAVKKLKNLRLRNGRPLKIIALLPFPTRHQVIVVKKAGIDAVVAEPFSAGILAEHVLGVLGLNYRSVDQG